MKQKGEEMTTEKYDSSGRNPNWELTCGFPVCLNFEKGGGSGGWCRIREGKPSVSITGGCALHTSNKATAETKGD